MAAIYAVGKLEFSFGVQEADWPEYIFCYPMSWPSGFQPLLAKIKIVSRSTIQHKTLPRILLDTEENG